VLSKKNYFKITITVFLSLFLHELQSETIKTVNNTEIDSLVLDIYIESRVQQPSNQITAEQRLIFLNELSDIYLLSTQENAKKLNNNPQIQAQIELQNRMLLAQSMANEYYSSINLSEEEILIEYNNAIKNVPTKEYKAKHILLETQGEAISIIEKLEQGEKFEELAKSHSIGPSASDGGSLGNWFSPNQMVKPFSDAVASLNDGAYSKNPVQTEFGWHVILREESRNANPPTIDSVRNEIQQKIMQDKFQNYLNQIRKNSE
jgi:peptidyl-prolyl cis-trans isomerase C